MKSIIYIFLIFVVYSGFADGMERVMFSYDGVQYESVVHSTDLINLPIWNENEEYPPLSPRQAMSISKQVAEGIVGHDEVEIEVESISLLSINFSEYWVYMVEYNSIPLIGYDGYMSPIKILVTLDGTPIYPNPKVSKGKGSAKKGVSQ